jgi:hypothetical protein
MSKPTSPTEFRAEILADGRKRVTVFCPEWPRNDYNPQSYTTVRNIDGSNRLMSDKGGWTFLPYDLEYGAHAAIAKAEGRAYQWAHCVPENHTVTA